MEDAPIVLICGHCGNKTVFEKCGAYSYNYHLPAGYEVEVTQFVLSHSKKLADMAGQLRQIRSLGAYEKLSRYEQD